MPPSKEMSAIDFRSYRDAIGVLWAYLANSRMTATCGVAQNV